jgi:autotransporter-associated beta strand protein
MKTTIKAIELFLYVLLVTLVPRFAFADLVGPYTPDANTLFLLHFDEAAGGSATTNLGTLGGNFYSVTEASASTTPATVTTMLGAVGYVNGATNFNHCMTNPTTGYLFGYDYNKSGAYDGDASGTVFSADRLGMTNLNIGNGGQSPFTLEALIQPTTTGGNQEIICTDSSVGSRGFQFRISSGSLSFAFILGSSALTYAIPTTGADAFIAGTWYHVAFTYDGTKGTLYWTKLDPSVGAAHVLTSGNLTMGTADGAVTGPLVIGNENRNVAGEQFLGSIDEVRISSVCRAANQMQFFSPVVTITQNPVSQNVDYNQPVSFSVGASSLTLLGYQWRFNSTPIAGGTSSTYVITNVAALNAGSYDCVVTNTAGYSSTSSAAQLVVGAAHFLNNRYSFTTDASDSIGGANGTLYGNAVVSGGALVLDGTSGTYMEITNTLFNGTNATALTVEFWATYGGNANNAYVFSFGYTNIVGGTIQGHSYVNYSPHTSTGQGLFISPGDNIFQQSVTNTTTLDGQTMHVACVIDPPNQILAIYTNGVIEAINTNMTVGLANVNDVFSYIGRSLFAADPYLMANIDELRIYKGALSSISIKQSDDEGPNMVLADGPANFVIEPVNATVPVGQTATFSAAAVGYLPITYQWFKNGSPLSGATNASYSFITALSDNNSTFFCYVTNTIGVTTYITNSTTATLTVFLPPTLAWLGTSAGGADNTWNTSSLDWTNDLAGGGVIAFVQTNGVLFDDRSGGGSVDVEQTITPYKITVNASSGYAFTSYGSQGSLVGQAPLTKLNTGTLTIDLTNNLSGGTTISGGILQVGSYDALGSLGSGPVTNNAKLSFARSDTILNVANAIHGSGIVSFDGGGATTMSGANDYTGSTFLNAGIVYLASSTGLGSPSSGTTVANGAQLYITANVDMAEGLTLAGSGGDGNGALRKGGAGATTATGPIFLSADSTINVDGSATLTLSNAVSGTAALTANGTGTLALNADNSFTGGFTLNGPIVNLGANHALSSGLVTISGAGRFVLADGLTIHNAFLASTVSPASGTGLLMVNDNTNGTITTISGPIEFDVSPANGGDFMGPNSSGYLNVTGPITNAVSGVVSSRSGLVRFSGGGNYTLFNLNAGTVSLGANNGLSPSAALAVAASADGTFDLNGFNQALTGLSDGATFTELVTNSAAALSTLIMNLSGASSYSGTLAGNLALIVNGTGSLALTGTNAYTGNTTVNGGTLEIAQPTLAVRSTVTVASGALLQLDFATTNTVAGLALNGVSQPLGVYNSTTSPSFMSGSGNLLVGVTVATNPTNIVTSVSGTHLIMSWPADHTGWRLLAQTNNLAKGLSTNPNDWGTVSGSANTNQVNVAIDPTKPTEFYRLVYP